MKRDMFCNIFKKGLWTYSYHVYIFILIFYIDYSFFFNVEKYRTLQIGLLIFHAFIEFNFCI